MIEQEKDRQKKRRESIMRQEAEDAAAAATAIEEGTLPSGSPVARTPPRPPAAGAPAFDPTEFGFASLEEYNASECLISLSHVFDSFRSAVISYTYGCFVRFIGQLALSLYLFSL